MESNDKIKLLQYLIVKAEKINPWRKRTLTSVLTILAPKIALLYNQSYCDYTLVQTLSYIINKLTFDFQPTMNWIENNKLEEIEWLLIKIKVEKLFKTVNKIEKSLL